MAILNLALVTYASLFIILVFVININKCILEIYNSIVNKGDLSVASD